MLAQPALSETALATPTRFPTPTPLPTITPEPTPLPASAAPPTSVQPTPLSATLRRQVYDKVWELVDEKYLYPDFNGLNWANIYDEYLPRIEQAQSNDDFYADLSEMIALLDDHHSRFLPPAAAQSQDTSNTGVETTVGIGIIASYERDSGYISTVFPDSPAALADIRPRDRIIAVDGHPYTQDDGDLQGLAGTTVRLNIQRPGEKPYDVVVVRQEVQGRVVPTYKRMHGDIGYLSIPTLWVEDMDAQVSGAITELVAAGPMSGMIVDLRGNGGGWEHVLAGILGHFVRGPVGTFYDQRSSRTLNVTSSAGPDVRRIPLIILIDGDTQSYAEVLAAVLQEGGAKVVGVPSAGNTESIYVYSLRDGSRLWLAQENFKLRSGANLEGRGVQPDSLVDVDWKRYSEEDDPQILEALRLLGAGPK
ncbi:PDZ domain-containing protein [Chloroflexia bacterium SDU3-3]|nr:PDZ domain-containing protein [Chloroflexia bacterium SDU3-3]